MKEQHFSDGEYEVPLPDESEYLPDTTGTPPGNGDAGLDMAEDWLAEDWPEKAWQDEDWLVEDEADDDTDDSVSEKVKMELYDWMQCIVSAIICGIFIFVFIGRTIGVEGDSMRQTLHYYDRVIMSNLFYTPKNGDIVVFQSPSSSFGGIPLVKRVIAVAGQTLDIDFETGDVMVYEHDTSGAMVRIAGLNYTHDMVIDEKYINELTQRRIDFSGSITVPEGYVFVMGDNRNHSSDSRDNRVGLVDTRYILGKVLFLLIPGGADNDPRNWSRFGMVYN